MATSTIEKQKTQYSPEIQLEITKKYKSATRWFWSAFQRQPLMYGFALVLLVASTYLTTKTIALVGDVLDILLIDINAGTIFSTEFNSLIVRMIIFVLISWVSLSLNIYIWADATFRVQRDMRQEFYEVIQDHSMAFYDINDSGVILSMGMNEINQIRMAIHPGFRMLLSSMFTIIITTVLLIQYDWIVGVVLAVSFAIYLIIAWRYAAKVGPIRQKLATDLGDLSAISQEMFRGVEVVRAFDNHEKEINKFNAKSLEYAEDMKKEGFLSAFYWPALITIVVTAGAFAYGLWMVTSSTGTSFTIGVLISILGLLMSLNRQNFMIPQRLIMLQAGLENSQRLWSMMTFDDPLQQPENPIEGDWEKDIHFKDVNFAYPGTEKVVLKNISFTIPTGSKVALIGGPGSGKSTILKLLLRLYDPTNGSIEVDGTRLDSIHTNYVRSNVTMVEQDIFLFSDTLRANITFAKPQASDKEIKSAAERAQISQFIETLPNKYETVIGERGVTLSGGQRQRIAIARALLSDPKLLLLDDSTSAVDIKTELRLRYAMEELMKDRTSIVVTQRLTTLVAADIIILMKRGEIVDIGSHEELLQRCVDYQFMCQHLPMAESMGVYSDIDVLEGGSK
ncbi:MAG: ABC transporter ATP-binding protein [Asgard group archaeon]|nr:ABC transporter ATP-binding protein [Asgard group archaeon]